MVIKFLIILFFTLGGKSYAFDCNFLIQQQELLFKIPGGLLKAIGLQESGKTFHNNKRVVWPWTVHANGEGHYFNSKQEAIKAVREMQAQGIESIDVGCMQINLKYHPDAFQSLESAFDPQTNIKYAANYLNNLKNQYGSWYQAIAYYHSATPSHHIPYRQSVLSYWKKTHLNNSNSQNSLMQQHIREPLVQFEAYPPLIKSNKKKRNIYPPLNFLPLKQKTPPNSHIKVTHKYFQPDSKMQKSHVDLVFFKRR